MGWPCGRAVFGTWVNELYYAEPGHAWMVLILTSLHCVCCGLDSATAVVEAIDLTVNVEVILKDWDSR